MNNEVIEWHTDKIYQGNIKIQIIQKELNYIDNKIKQLERLKLELSLKRSKIAKNNNVLIRKRDAL